MSQRNEAIHTIASGVFAVLVLSMIPIGLIALGAAGRALARVAAVTRGPGRGPRAG